MTEIEELKTKLVLKNEEVMTLERENTSLKAELNELIRQCKDAFHLEPCWIDNKLFWKDVE